MAEYRYEASTARGAEMARKLQELEGTIHFVVDRLGKSQVPENTASETCRLMMPTCFVQEHGDKLHEVIVLRSTSSSIPCRVRLRIYNTPPSKAPAIKFGRGWRDFATCNGLVVGDSLIFELRGLSQFEVHVFRGTGLPIEISSSQVSQAPKAVSTDSEISQRDAFDYNLNASSNRFQHLVGERSEGSEDDDDLCEAVTRKRKLGEEDAASASRRADPHNPSIKLRLSELENALVSSTKNSQGSQNSQQPTPFVRQLLSMPSIGNRHGSQSSHDFLQAHHHHGLRVPFNLNVSAHRSYSPGNGDVKMEFHQPHVKVTLPSFIHKLLDHNVQDSAGNTSGARFVSSSRSRPPVLRAQGSKSPSSVKDKSLVLQLREALDVVGKASSRCLELLMKPKGDEQEGVGLIRGSDFCLQNVPLAFVKKHSVRLNAHVELQGTRDGSPSRTVTCSYDMLQDHGASCPTRVPLQDGASCPSRVPLSLGWGDFVRDNGLQAGQELVFTLASDSFFVVKEVAEIVIYTK